MIPGPAGPLRSQERTGGAQPFPLFVYAAGSHSMRAPANMACGHQPVFVIDHSWNAQKRAADLQAFALGKVLEAIDCNVNAVPNIQPVQNSGISLFLSAEYNARFKPFDHGIWQELAELWIGAR